jgi:hypothetical protein
MQVCHRQGAPYVGLRGGVQKSKSKIGKSGEGGIRVDRNLVALVALVALDSDLVLDQPCLRVYKREVGIQEIFPEPHSMETYESLPSEV